MSINIRLSPTDIAPELDREPGMLLALLAALADRPEPDLADLIGAIAETHDWSPAHDRIAPFLRALATALDAESALAKPPAKAVFRHRATGREVALRAEQEERFFENRDPAEWERER
jgi:hypothetical protein